MSQILNTLAAIPSHAMQNSATIFGIAGFDFLFNMIGAYLPLNNNILVYVWNGAHKAANYFIYQHLSVSLLK